LNSDGIWRSHLRDPAAIVCGMSDPRGRQRRVKDDHLSRCETSDCRQEKKGGQRETGSLFWRAERVPL
jgi:hypothetical protein